MNKLLLNRLSALYLGLPLMIFCIGYLRWYVAWGGGNFIVNRHL